jgi:hypothetical protein
MTIDRLRIWSASLSILAVRLTSIPVRAQSFSDVTGGNVWNNPAPIFESEGLDPELVVQIERVNREAAAAYQACDREALEARDREVISQNQQIPPSPRRYARPDSPYRLPALPLPQACYQYSELVREANRLRQIVAEMQQSRFNPDLNTW